MTFKISTEILSLPFSPTQISSAGFDLDDYGGWLAIVDTGGERRLWSPFSDAPLPVLLPYAKVRCLGELALVVSPRLERQNEINAWIIERERGAIRNAFSVGDGVADVVVLADFIVVSYFDEGVFGRISPSYEGIAVFDRDGTYLWGYASGVTRSVEIIDCYAMCRAGRNHLAFCAYREFSLVILDVSRRDQTVISTPKSLHGSNAIACTKDTVFFCGPYADGGNDKTSRDSVFAFNRATEEAVRLGRLPGCVRALSRGRILSIDDGNVAITTFIA